MPMALLVMFSAAMAILPCYKYIHIMCKCYFIHRPRINVWSEVCRHVRFVETSSKIIEGRGSYNNQKIGTDNFRIAVFIYLFIVL